MNHEEIAEVLAKPISQELLGSSIPARLAYVGVDGGPRVIRQRGPLSAGRLLLPRKQESDPGGRAADLRYWLIR